VAKPVPLAELLDGRMEKYGIRPRVLEDGRQVIEHENGEGVLVRSDEKGSAYEFSFRPVKGCTSAATILDAIEDEFGAEINFDEDVFYEFYDDRYWPRGRTIAVRDVVERLAGYGVRERHSENPDPRSTSLIFGYEGVLITADDDGYVRELTRWRGERRPRGDRDAFLVFEERNRELASPIDGILGLVELEFGIEVVPALPYWLEEVSDLEAEYREYEARLALLAART